MGATPRKLKLSKRSEQGADVDEKPPVIIILGQTGVGKSNFIYVAGKHMSVPPNPKIGDGLESCTGPPQEYILSDPDRPNRSVRLIDTPGFNDTTAEGDDKQLKLIIEWLRQEPKAKLVGILFLFEITQPRVAKTPGMMNPTHIENPPGVFVVTTKWSDGTDQSHCDADARKEEQLQQIFELQPNAMKRFYNTPDSAWAIINEVWNSSEASKITLEKVRELLELIRPHLKEPDKLMRKIGKWFAKLF
ncbi:hypothetical protein HYPSUDRAFT_52568 [Hypholoma sublateritium FD-334 SS-4]|uniref:Uncharacterized protein n=1 Tax=Hypholoma sublateritium (strain FD-334 SS-4) TaxID=945553 RepID=A0A0D2Q3S4_HYPSF|nr:hypothetical protein HYPSUDRAFT_52568 [Hypholoma sublateritium FD-334 SS-4]